MVDINKLKGKIVECGLNVESLANMIEVSKSTLYRHFSCNGEDLSIKEVNIIARALGLNHDEVMDIFFSQKVA